MDFKGKKAAQFCCNNGREILSLMQLVACIILDIDEMYHNSFDFIMFTIEAITWFEDMNPQFKVKMVWRFHLKLFIFINLFLSFPRYIICN